jgi:hypothetical protein
MTLFSVAAVEVIYQDEFYRALNTVLKSSGRVSSEWSADGSGKVDFYLPEPDSKPPNPTRTSRVKLDASVAEIIAINCLVLELGSGRGLPVRDRDSRLTIPSGVLNLYRNGF